MRHTWPYAIHAIFIVILLGLYLVISSRIDALLDTSGNPLGYLGANFDVGKVQRDLQGLLLAADDLASGRKDDPLAVQHEYDFLWSRLETMLNRRSDKVFSGGHLDREKAENYFETIKEIEPLIFNLKQGDNNTYAHIRTILDKHLKDAHDWARISERSHQEQVINVANVQRELASNLRSMQFILLTAVILFSLLLLWDGVNVRNTNEKLRVSKEAIRTLASTDPVTGLHNRSHFESQIDKLTLQSSNRTFQFLYIDLDGFKRINDTYGHEAGDKLLRETATRIRSFSGVDDITARIGGDEFVVAFFGDAQQAQQRARQINTALSKPFTIGGAVVHISSSVGIAEGETGAAFEPRNMMRSADLAMYAAKKMTSNRIRLFDSSLLRGHEIENNLERDLPGAIERGEITVTFQPLMDLQRQMPVAIEALVRWEHVDFGPIPPNQLIEIAERTGFGENLELHILICALTERQKVAEAGHDLRLLINVSPLRASSAGFISSIANVLQEFDLPPQQLTLEFTEDMMMQDGSAAIRNLRALKELGVSTAVDDFGTGYSNLGYFGKYQFDVVKIDRSFIEDIHIRKESRTIVRCICAMAEGLGMTVVAEGIESSDELATLREFGIQEVQGYFFTRPLKIDQLVDWLEENASDSRFSHWTTEVYTGAGSAA